MITPSEARKINKVVDLVLAAWESKIDQALARFDGQSIQVDVQRTTNKIREKLIEMYSKAGWTVKLGYGDQRDPGPWLEFTV